MVEKRRMNCREGLHQRGTMHLLPCGGQANSQGKTPGATTSAAILACMRKARCAVAEGNPALATSSDAVMRQSSRIFSRNEQPRSLDRVCQAQIWVPFPGLARPSIQESGSTRQALKPVGCSAVVKEPGGVLSCPPWACALVHVQLMSTWDFLTRPDRQETRSGNDGHGGGTVPETVHQIRSDGRQGCTLQRRCGRFRDGARPFLEQGSETPRAVHPSHCRDGRCCDPPPLASYGMQVTQ